MKRIHDKLTLALVFASDGVIVEKARQSGWYEKRTYHAKCFRKHALAFDPSWGKLFFLVPGELGKPHWSKRRCGYCQHRLAEDRR
jgi:hypothetical protein